MRFDVHCEVDLNDEDIVRTSRDLGEAIHDAMTDEVLAAIRASDQWHQLRRSIYAAVLEQIREEILTDFRIKQTRGEHDD